MNQSIFDSSSSDVASLLLQQEQEAKLNSDETVYFLVIQVLDNDVETTKTDVEQVTRLLIQLKGRLVCIASSILLATIGDFESDKESSPSLQNVAETIVQHFGGKVKAVYGCKRGYYGFVGASPNLQLGPIIPQFNSALQHLLSLKYGQAQSVD